MDRKRLGVRLLLGASIAMLAVAPFSLLAACAAAAPAASPPSAPSVPPETSPTTTVSSTTSTQDPTTSTAPNRIDLPIAPDDSPAYEVLFSLRADGEEVTYQGSADVTDFPLTGPQALTVADDGTIWIADTEALRLIRVDQTGGLLLDVGTDRDAVGPLIDVAPYRGGVIGLEAVPALARYRVVWYSGEGELLAAGELPPGLHLSDGLTGIAAGSQEEIWIELHVGELLYEVSNLGDALAPVPVDGYPADSVLLRLLSPVDGRARIALGDVVVEYPFQEHGSLVFEGALPGMVAVLHSNLWLDEVIVVEDTVIYVALDGQPLAEARYPLDEVAYVPRERIAVAPDGRLIALVPRDDRIDVVALTLYPAGHFDLRD